MSVWKSPVFYFGIGLIMLVSALLLAPYVLDWNSYKPDLEAYGKLLTGRTVTIEGDVEIRLFPVPRLLAEGVAIGNPEGMEGEPLIHTEVLTLSLQLGSLLNGTLDVRSVELLEPQVTLIRDAAGHVNWLLKSDEDLRRSKLLQNVRLDHINLLNGSVRLDDRARGLSALMSTIDAEVSAENIEGPWKLKGTGNWRDLPLAFNFSSSQYKDGEPFRFGFRATPGDTVIPVFAMDGGWLNGAFDGGISITPQVADGQKGSVEGGLRPLAFKAKLKASAERADLSEIRIAPVDTSDSGTLIEGTATVDLAASLRGDIRLKSPRMNLDTLLGAESLNTWRAGGVLALGQSLLRNVPPTLKADFALDVSVLTAGGETMNDARLAAAISPDGIAISDARAGLPGRSAVRLTEGLVKRKDGAAEVSGILAFESGDLRAFAGWALPSRKAEMESWWKGSRGRVKLQSSILWSQAQVSMRKIDFELEGLPGQGELVLRQGSIPSLDVRITTQALDIDSFLQSGGGQASGKQAFEVLGFVNPVLRGAETFEKHVTLDAGTVTLNGVRAQDVAFDVATSQSGIEIKAFDIGSVGGARLKAEGLILSSAEGASGDISASLIADDPSGFLRLVGLADTRSDWARTLGQTQLGLSVKAAPDSNGPVLSYSLKGTALPFTLDMKGAITELERGADARISLEGGITTPDAARLVALAGLSARYAATGPGKMGLNFSGSKSGGFGSKIELEAYGARATFDGSLKVGEPYAAASGAVSVFAADVAPSLRALGAPLADGPGGNLRLAFKISPSERGLKLTDVVGDHAGLALAGEASLSGDGKLAGDFSIGDITLHRLVALVFSPWNGFAGLSEPFAGPEVLPFTGEIWLRPRNPDLPYVATVQEAAIGITLGQTRKLSLLAPTIADLGFTISVAKTDAGFEAGVEGKIPVELSRVLIARDGAALGSGQLVISGAAKGAGRSPAAALAQLEGKGAYTLRNLAYTRLAPDDFARRLPDVKTAGELSAALEALEAAPGLSAESAGGTFEISKGQLQATPVRVSGLGTLSIAQASADFTQRIFELRTSVSLTGRTDLPEVAITYSGVPGQLERRARTAGLASKLGHQMLARDLEELERLKTEQEKLAVIEENQRLQDQAKFEAYQAQRAEIRMRQRALKVHLLSREKLKAREETAFAAFVPEGDVLNRIDLAKRRLELAVKPQLALWAEENERRRLEEEERQRALAEKLRLEEEARLMKIEEEKARAEAERLRVLAEEEARIAEARRKAEEDASKAEEARLKAEADARALAEEKARQEAERLRLEEEARKAAERLQLEEEARRKLLEVEQLGVTPVMPQFPQQAPPLSPPTALPKPLAAPAPDCGNPLYC